MRAFDMSRYERVIATEGDVRGSFVVHGVLKDGELRIFRVEILDVTLWDDDRGWGRIINPGEFDVDITDGVLTVGKRRAESKKHDIDEFEDRINATLALVAAAFHGGPGSVVEAADTERSTT